MLEADAPSGAIQLKGRRLLAEYDKSTARSFYRGHLVAYSLLNTLVVLARGSPG